ncbi:hypothetical protein K438DRAFT_1955459 [Mycena galopus ATCC 62051]|nr:hypothetical protein K438DRAFT_1955459 [Mycena galopus ATCC 62051]
MHERVLLAEGRARFTCPHLDAMLPRPRPSFQIRSPPALRPAMTPAPRLPLGALRMRRPPSHPLPSRHPSLAPRPPSTTHPSPPSLCDGGLQTTLPLQLAGAAAAGTLGGQLGAHHGCTHVVRASISLCRSASEALPREDALLPLYPSPRPHRRDCALVACGSRVSRCRGYHTNPAMPISLTRDILQNDERSRHHNTSRSPTSTPPSAPPSHFRIAAHLPCSAATPETRTVDARVIEPPLLKSE